MKYIYGIHFENNKWYVGRTIDFNRRKSEHIYSATHENASDYDSKKYKAMRKYKYEFIILQEVEDEMLLPRLEKEWIERLNSLEDGYNMSEGGESYNLKGEFHSQAKLTQKEVNCIIDLLQNTDISMQVIANQFNVSKATICNINRGRNWINKNINYPLRATNYATLGEKHPGAIFTDKKVIEIRIMYQYKSLTEIYNLYSNRSSYSAIEKICLGESYKHLPIYKKKQNKWINIK